jgi:hypothetical protein
MVDDTEFVENLYASPSPARQPRRRTKIVRWLLLGLATMQILFSIPIAWRMLELANQEYLHLWNPQRAIYDIEINGLPVSNSDATRIFGRTMLIQWGIAAVLLFAAQFFRTKSN